MKINSATPVTIWVVGTSTNVGKTTAATALIRYLNATAIPTLGFKPIAGGRLRDLVDFAMEHYSRLPGRIFGSDGLKLAMASALTQEDDVDLVTPWQLVFHRTIDDTILLRAGSTSLNNVRYYKSALTAKMLERADFVRLAKTLELPLDNAEFFDPSIDRRSQLTPDIQARAFAALLERKPSAIVIEGAGFFLPTWRGAPLVNHVIAVSDDEIALYPNVNMHVRHHENKGGRLSTQQLLKALLQRGLANHRVPQYIIETVERDAVMEQLMQELLYKAKHQFHLSISDSNISLPKPSDIQS